MIKNKELLLLFSLIFLAGCSSPKTELSFEGTWQFNYLKSESEGKEFKIAVKGDKFKVDAFYGYDNEREVRMVYVYDGEKKYIKQFDKRIMMYKTTEVNVPRYGEGSIRRLWEFDHKTDSSIGMWKKTKVSGNEMIAGRKAIKYQFKYMAGVAYMWFDKETGIVLKRSQPDDNKETVCTDISFGFVDDSQFVKPE